MYFILLGLPKNSPRVPEHLHGIVREGLEHNAAVFKDAGLDYADCLIEPEQGSKPLMNMMSHREPDGIIVGFGVRGSDDLEITYFFEQIVNAVRVQYPKTTILFNTRPQSTLDAVRRWFPTA